MTYAIPLDAELLLVKHSICFDKINGKSKGNLLIEKLKKALMEDA